MTRMCLLSVALSFVGCAAQPAGNVYKVRTLGVHGDGGQHLLVSGVQFTFKTSQTASQRKRIDLKAEIRNDSAFELRLGEVGAELRATSTAWAPLDWTVYCSGRSTGESATIKPGEQCWLMCSFEIPEARRERFPRNVTVSIGSVSLGGQRVDVGPIQLYIPG